MYPAILVRQSHQQFRKQMNCKSVLKAGILRARAKGRSDRTTQGSLLRRDRATRQRNAAHFTAQLTCPSGSCKRSSARHAKCFHLRAMQRKARCSCFEERTPLLAACSRPHRSSKQKPSRTQATGPTATAPRAVTAGFQILLAFSC